MLRRCKADVVEFLSSIGFLSFIPFVAAIGGFEYAYKKKASSATEKTKLRHSLFFGIVTIMPSSV